MHSNHTTENGRKPQETTQVNAKCCCVKVREYQVTVHLFPGLSRMGCKPVQARNGCDKHTSTNRCHMTPFHPTVGHTRGSSFPLANCWGWSHSSQFPVGRHHRLVVQQMLYMQKAPSCISGVERSNYGESFPETLESCCECWVAAQTVWQYWVASYTCMIEESKELV